MVDVSRFETLGQTVGSENPQSARISFSTFAQLIEIVYKYVPPEAAAELKLCNCCATLKPADSFYVKQSARAGREGTCKSCRNQQRRNRRKAVERRAIIPRQTLFATVAREPQPRTRKAPERTLEEMSEAERMELPSWVAAIAPPPVRDSKGRRLDV